MVSPDPRPILVVDDEPSIRENLGRLLSSNGYDVTEAENGETALEHATKVRFEIVLLDIGMPGMSGFDVLDRFANESPDTAVIMITAVTDVDSAVSAMKKGAYDFIAKPFSLEDVLVRVERALERRAMKIQERRHQRMLEKELGEQKMQIDSQFKDLVRSLGREHDLQITLQAGKRGKDRDEFNATLPKELQARMSSLDEFKDALLRILHRTQL